jgi:hypothetical protein
MFGLLSLPSTFGPLPLHSVSFTLSLSLCLFLFFLTLCSFSCPMYLFFPSVSSPLYLPRSLNQPLQISYIYTLGPPLSAPLSLPLQYLLYCLSHLSLPIFRSVSFHCLLHSASFSLSLPMFHHLIYASPPPFSPLFFPVFSGIKITSA